MLLDAGCAEPASSQVYTHRQLVRARAQPVYTASVAASAMDTPDLVIVQQKPAWFTPARLLAIFCLTNLVVYLDRGLISSNGVNGSPRTEDDPQGSGIQGDFNLTYFEDGLLPAAFLAGLLVSSPIFAEVCKQYSAFRLLGIGMAVWSAACILCGAAPTFGALLTSRAFVGVGEASFVALAAPFIDDYAPPASKSKWFACFYLCIPVGFAFGYIFGGIVAPALGWRAAFFIQGAAMIPFVIFALRSQPLHLKGTHDEKQLLAGTESVAHSHSQSHAGSAHSADGTCPHHHSPVASHHQPASKRGCWAIFVHHARNFQRDVALVLRQRVYVLMCTGYTLYVAVLGVYAYWGPQAGKALFFPAHSGGQTADLVFGGVTVLTGVLGSVLGGVLLDSLGNTLRLANLLCCLSVLSAVVVLIPSFTLTNTFASFMAVFAVGQLLMFGLQAPVVAVQMWCVPQPLRALAASLTTMSIHLLGDVPSPPLLGALQSRLSEGKTPQEAAQMWRVSMSLVSSLLVISSFFFLLAAQAAKPSADFRQKPVGDDSPRVTDRLPLLNDVEAEDGTQK